MVVRVDGICHAQEVRTLQGRVASGMGDLSRWMIEYADLYEQCTGVRLYPGSLNMWSSTRSTGFPHIRRCGCHPPSWAGEWA
jgi:CTP-dependent riboflavin kinase